MKITYKKMTLTNFMSYRNETFDFCSHEGMNIITGVNNDIPEVRNGCGKSALCNSLVYALFGELPEKMKNQVHTINWYAEKKEMSVELYFSIDKKRYKIVSGTRKGSSYCWFFEIVDGKENEITKSTIAETRKMIENDIIKQDKMTFIRSVLLNSNPLYNFYNLGKADKDEFIERLFHLEEFGNIFSSLHSKSVPLNREISAKQRELMVYTSNNDDYERRKIEFEETKAKEISNLESEIKKLGEQLNTKMSTVIERNTEKITKFTKFVEKVDDEINKKKDENGKLDMSRMKINNIISQFKSHIKDRRSIIDRHSVLLSKLCPDCKKIASSHYSLDKYEDEIKKIDESIKSETMKLKSVVETIEKNKTTVSEFIPKREKAIKMLNDMNSEFEKNQKEMKSIENMINTLNSKLSTMKTSTNPYIDLIETNKKKIETTNEEIAKMIYDYTHMIEVESIVGHENLKKTIIADLVGTLNNGIQSYLTRLGSDYGVVFDSEMNYEFTTRSDKSAEFNNFSLGEKARISIATCLAFRDFLNIRHGISSNILMLDEFIDSNIDTMAIGRIIDILKEFSEKENINIFVISHRSEVSENDAFNSVITITRTNGESKISSEKIV